MLITTNLGYKCEVGNDFVDSDTNDKSNVQQDKRKKVDNNVNAFKNIMPFGKAKPDPKKFESHIPQGGKVISLAGFYNNKTLLSVYAYYN